jgi:predicted MFS family arabinose efflux permease
MAAAGLIFYGLMVTFLAKETLPQRDPNQARKVERFGGYGRILRDRQFMSFNLVFTLTQICAALIWVLLAVYAKQNYQVPENRYGFIPMTNALMVVFFQIWVTQKTKGHAPMGVLALGSLFYALGVGSVVLGGGFWGFWTSMVILTIGELILSPTATTLAANLAPPDMRGRYMSLYGLTWNVAAGIGPVLGGLLNDNISPVAIWYGGALVGMVATLGFVLLSRRYPQLVVTQAAVVGEAD